MEFGEMNWVTKMDVGEQVRCKIKAIKHNAKGAPYIQAVDNSNGQFFMINILFEQAEELEGLEDVIMTCTGYNDKGYRILSFDVPSDGNTLRECFEDEDDETPAMCNPDTNEELSSLELEYVEYHIKQILYQFNARVEDVYFNEHFETIQAVEEKLLDAICDIHKDEVCDETNIRKELKLWH